MKSACLFNADHAAERTAGSHAESGRPCWIYDCAKCRAVCLVSDIFLDELKEWQRGHPDLMEQSAPIVIRAARRMRREGDHLELLTIADMSRVVDEQLRIEQDQPKGE